MEAFVHRRVGIITKGALVALLVLAAAIPSAAQAPRHIDPPGSAMPSIDEVARALAEAMTPRWEGPRVPWPAPTPRPAGRPAQATPGIPVLAHGPAGVSDASLAASQRALEDAYFALSRLGLTAPYPDGGRGGSDALDLYLLDDLSRASAAADPRVAATHLDAVSAFATLGRVPAESLSACVAEAYANALLLARDPGEDADLRASMAAFIAQKITGHPGCDNGAENAQSATQRSFLRGPDGALFWRHLSQLHDGGSGAFPLALFEISRQHTNDDGDLRARPDLPGALEAALARSGHSLRATVESFAVDRYLLGQRGDAPPIAARPAPPPRSSPLHVGPINGGLEVFGSDYTRVDVRGAPEGARLQIWLEGERGADWSLTAVSLDAAGSERARVSTPSGDGVRRGYVVLELLPGVRSVLLVVTNLGDARSASRATAEETHNFRLTASLAGPR